MTSKENYVDSDDSNEDCGSETIETRHKQERKELQVQIMKLKRSVGKGDKKKKKDINTKIALMEAEMDERHDKELKAEGSTTALTNDMAGLEVTEFYKKVELTDEQKSKLEKRKADAEAREAALKQQEQDNLLGPRHIETQKIKSRLKDRKLAIYEIPSDGNCLFAGVKHQLDQQGKQFSVASLRQQVADHIREYADDFMPFLSNHVTGDPFSEEEFKKYCDDLQDTPAWGGQLEIQALSMVLRTPIEVVQSDGPPVTTGENFTEKPILLVYHRHMYGLGEHYNSVTDYVEEKADDFT